LHKSLFREGVLGVCWLVDFWIAKGETMESFEKELQNLINRHSMENASNTPDFILAQFMRACLDAWNTGVQQRENWYGRDPRPFKTGETSDDKR